MEYKGYTGIVEFDDEAEIFHGEVANLRAVITFQGRSVDELREAFEGSVDDYLEWCAERRNGAASCLRSADASRRPARF